MLNDNHPKLTLKAAITSVVSLGGFCFSMGLCASIERNILSIMLAGLSWLFLCVAFLLTLNWGLKYWIESSRLWMLPSLICFGFCATPWIVNPIGDAVNDWHFQRNLEAYYKIVLDIKNGPISKASTFQAISANKLEKLDPRITTAYGVHLEDGSVVVEFFHSGAFGVTEGYTYRELMSSDKATLSALQRERRFRLRHIIDGWYRFAAF